MQGPLTIVMYHYVRPLARSNYPALNALDLTLFDEQLAYLSKHYTIISPALLRACIAGTEHLPDRACLLSFDDGYSDHYRYVFPALHRAGLSALFFAPAMSLLDRQILEVNKIQFVLAACSSRESLASDLNAALSDHPEIHIAALQREYSKPNRFDSASVNYFKRLLQHVLPVSLRAKLVDRFFEQHVGADQNEFADELYLTLAEAHEMEAEGMEFGAHGDRHLWHNRCSDSELDTEIAGSLRVLEAIGRRPEEAFYCYPFGGHDKRVLKEVNSAGFIGAFSVEPGLARLVSTNFMCLPRLDTNDFPKAADAPTNSWFQAIAGAT